MWIDHYRRALSKTIGENKVPVPKYDDLFNPLLQAIRNLGGSASLTEQEDEVASLLKLSDSELSEIHRGNRPRKQGRNPSKRGSLKRFQSILSFSTACESLYSFSGTANPLAHQ